jgi:hypothetical protein
MSTVATILAGAGYRLGGGITIGASSDPSQATCIAWLNEIALWITGLCAENNSDLGRTIGTVTTIHADISAATKAANCQVTATAHGLMGAASTAEVLIKDVVGMTDLNDKEFTATYVSADAVTLGVASSAYITYVSGGHIMKRKYSTLASYLYAPAQEGWIVDGHSREVIRLRDESCLLEYDPIEAAEPSEFYVDGANNVCFPSYPDDVYTIKIPYWTIPTALTTTTDPMPFLGLMDNVFLEALVIQAQGRDEYDITMNLRWQSFLLERAMRVISMRKSATSKVTL